MATRREAALDRMGAQIAAVFDPDDLEQAKNVIRKMLGATQRVRGGKGADGSYRYDDVPDNAIQFAAAVKVIEWNVGKPIARTVTQNDPGLDAAPQNGAGDLLSLMLENPEAASGVLQKLQDAAQKMKTAQPIDVQEVPKRIPGSS